MPQERKPRKPPATTVEGRQNQLMALAVDLLEKRLRDGTATSQEVTTLFKESTVRAQLERQKLEIDNNLALARIKEIEARENSEQRYAEAIDAMTRYQGRDGV